MIGRVVGFFNDGTVQLNSLSIAMNNLNNHIFQFHLICFTFLSGRIQNTLIILEKYFKIVPFYLK